MLTKVDHFIEADDARPPWLLVDGQIWPVKLFPELFAVLGNQYGGDGKTTFAVPPTPEDGMDDLANAQFGTTVVFRCIATHKLEDGTPAGTIAWCNQPPRSYGH
jgi:microcystin-dependent protein